MIRARFCQLIALCTGLIVAAAACADVWQPLERWRIEGGQVAPWAAPGTAVDPRYRGREVRFQSTRVIAPHPLACAGSQYEWMFVTAGNLFEGNLPAPAEVAARKLGLGAKRVATLRVSCPNAGFDFHRTAGGVLLLGLDNVVWTLRAADAASSPAEIVQELLLTHFTHDMGFTPQSVAFKQAFLSKDLHARMARWLAAPKSPDEAPEINGDPFTDSQEYPDRFTLGSARVSPQRAVVPANFGGRETRVDYVLVRDGMRWVVDDLLDARGQSLRALLDPQSDKRSPR